MSYYSAVTYLAVFSMVIMMLIVQSNDVLSRQQRRLFLRVFGIVVLSAMAEWLGIHLDGAPLFTRSLHIFVKAFELSLAPFLSAAYLHIIAGKKAAIRVAIPLAVHAVLAAVSEYQPDECTSGADFVLHGVRCGHQSGV